MNIAEICFSKAYGGLEMKFIEDARLLKAQGHYVLAFVSPNSPVIKPLQKLGFDPIILNVKKYFSPVSSLKMARAYRKYDIEAIHMHQSIDLGPALLAAQFAKVPARVFTLRMESGKKKNDIYHRWIYSNLTSVLTITKRLRKIVIDNRPIPDTNVHCLYNGLDIQKLTEGIETRSAIRDRWKISDGAFVCGIVGRLDPLKGQRVLTKAVTKLKDRIPNLILMIVGDETAGEEGELTILKKLVAEADLESIVIFTGHQSPPGSIVPAFDVAVMATKRETFGNVAVESSALGIPTIATNAGGAPEIIEDGVNGLLVTPEDPQSFADAIEKLYYNPEMRREMGEVGKRLMPKKFSVERHVEGLERALRRD